MEIRLFEIRDRATFIPAMAIRLGGKETPREIKLLASAGFGAEAASHEDYILLLHLDGGTGQFTSDRYEWNSRTMQIAHEYLYEHWDDLQSGEVVDVQHILGETAEPVTSELES